MKQERIDALREMVKRGTEHESNLARTILERAGIPPLEPRPDEGDTTVEIGFKTAFERDLIFQTYYSIFRDRDSLSYYTSRKKTVEIIVPKSHVKLMIEKSIKIIDDWRKQLRFFELAFIEKNNLHSDTKPTEPVSKKNCFSPEDIAQIFEMMSGISRTRIENLLKGFGVT